MNADESTITVESGDAGDRLDRFLAEHHPDRSRTFCQRLIESGEILVNDKPARNRTVIKEGDVILIRWPAENEHPLEPESIGLDIVYDDQYIIVIDKPPGLVVHPGAGHESGTLVNALLAYAPDRMATMIDSDRRPGIVHRLDRETSGLIVVACNPEARDTMIATFAARQVKKTYLAMVYGRPPQDRDRLDGSIGRHPRQRKKMAIITDGGKQAVTDYSLLESADAVSLIKASPQTGRTHQIRVHLADARCPVVGDPVYGGRRTHTIAAARTMLHAWHLEFAHPHSGDAMTFTAPIPEDFVDLCLKHGLNPAIYSPTDQPETDRDSESQPQ